LICDSGRDRSELKRFFTLRKAHWPFTQVNTHNAWHWEAATRRYSVTTKPLEAEQVNVSAAQNLRVSDGQVNQHERRQRSGTQLSQREARHFARRSEPRHNFASNGVAH